MKRLLLFTLLCGSLMTSCSEDMDDVVDDGVLDDPENVEIEDFIYRGMDEIYLYKPDIPELADDYFANDDEYYEYLVAWDSPADLFYSGLAASQDRFSYITDDYIELENSFSGISQTTGVDYRLYRFSNSNDVFGVVRYIVPGSNAEGTAIERGDLFTEVNGESLTVSNYASLLSSPSVTFTLAEINDNMVSNTGEEVTIATSEVTENPVLIQEVLEVEGLKIGYLMYNSFVADFDQQLNNAFAYFASENIEHLVLDLRYNGGGRVSSATALASMITGSYTGEIFAKQLQGGTALNQLNLTDLYVIGTSSTASASELVINGLKPYIDVYLIGNTTTGKSQASVTLYDSSNFGRTNANPNHTYAIQPLVYESVNADDIVVPYDGIDPDVEIEESSD